MELQAGLKRLRKELGLTQTELAEKLNISFTTINRWENRKATPTPLHAEVVMGKIRRMGVSPSCIEYLEGAFFPKTDDENDKLRQVDMLRANQILNESANGIIVSDLETYELLYINRTVERYRGIPAGKLQGQKCYEYLMNRTSPCPKCMRDGLTADTFATTEVRDATTGRYYSVRGKLIKWEGHRAHIEYLSDITESHRAQEALHDLTERVAVGMAICHMYLDDIHFDIDYFNEGFCKLIGRNRASCECMSDHSLFDQVFADDRAIIFEELRNAAAEDRKADVEIRLKHKDGRYIWCNVQGTIADRLANKVTFYLTFVDIDRRKQLRNALEENKRAMEIAAAYGDFGLWKYDLDTHKLEQDFTKSGFPGYPTVISHIPEAFIEQKVIHPEDEAAFLRMYREIQNGELRSECVARVFRPERKAYMYLFIVLIRQPDTAEGIRSAIGFCMSIKAPKQVQADLKKPEE